MAFNSIIKLNGTQQQSETFGPDLITGLYSYIVTDNAGCTNSSEIYLSMKLHIFSYYLLLITIQSCRY